MSIRSPPQLAHDRLDPGALEPHTGPDGVDGVVAAMHRDLGPAPDLARGFLDLDDALVDLRHLQLEQRRDKTGIRAGEDQAGTLGRLVHLLQDRPDRLALAKPLARVLFLPGNDGLGVAGTVQHENQLAALDLLHFAGQQVAHAVGVLVADSLPLALAHQLHDPLLGGHDGVAAELGEGYGNLHDVADLVGGVVPPRLVEQDLRRRVLHGLDDSLEDDHLDFARDIVNDDLGVDVGAEYACQAGMDPVSDEFVDLVELEALGIHDVAERSSDLRGVYGHDTLQSCTRRAAATRDRGTSTSSPSFNRSRIAPPSPFPPTRPRSSPSRRELCPRSASFPVTAICRPWNRRKSLSRVRGRSRPGEDTSRTYRSGTLASSSSQASMPRLTVAQSSRETGRSSAWRSTRRRMTGRAGLPAQSS